MKTLLIRGIPDDVHDSLTAAAERARRSKEKQALYLIEHGLTRDAAETCGELARQVWEEPPPEVDEKAIDAYLASRGRRSRRP